MSMQQDNKPGQSLSPKERAKAAGERARAEAEARRAARDNAPGSAEQPKEIDGRGGLDPVRYKDWEIKGLTSDF